MSCCNRLRPPPLIPPEALCIARAENAPGRHRHGNQDWPDNTLSSGPASAYGVIGRTEAAYFKMINDQGGSTARKINFISLDDAYSPPNKIEQVRRFRRAGACRLSCQYPSATAPNAAIRQYCNDNKRAAALRPERRADVCRPYALSPDDLRIPSYVTEARIYARHILFDQAGRKDRRPLSKR